MSANTNTEGTKYKSRPLRTSPITILKSEKSSVALHSHRYYEFVYVASGSAEHICNDTRYTLIPGNYFIVPPYVNHGYAPINNEKFCIYNVCFTPNIIDKSFSIDTPISEMLEHPLVGLNVKNKDFSSLDKVFFCNDSSMLFTVGTAMTEYAHKSAEYSKVLQHIVCMILVMLSRNLSSTTDEDKENNFVSEIKDYINENFSSNVELGTICKKLGYNSHYVGNTFKKQTGLTFTEYLHKVRIKRACFLLTSTTMSIAQVANEIGYQNVTYFYRVFKAKMGVDPKTFRNSQT